MRKGLNLGWRSRNVPLLLQNEAAECGLACIGMISCFHGRELDLQLLRNRYSVSLKGLTLLDLSKIAGQLCLGSRALRVELVHLKHLNAPCILHWDLNHFVVLVAVRGRGKQIRAVIHDPARGIRELSINDVSRHFTGIVLELMPMPGFEKKVESQSVSVRQLLGPVHGMGPSLLQILALATALELFALLVPFFTQWVVDGVLVTGDRDLLTALGIGFALLICFIVVTSCIRAWSVLYLSAQLNLHWLGNVFAQLMRLPLTWFERRHAGDVLSRFGSIQRIQQTLTTSFIEAILDGLLVVLTLAMMLYFSTILTAVAVAAVLLYAGTRYALFSRAKLATEEALVHESKQSSHFLESLRGVQSIKLFNRQEDRQARFLNLVVDAMNAQLAVRKVDLLLANVHKLVFGLERVFVIWIGAILVLEQRFSVGMLFAFFAYKETFSSRISALIDKLVELGMLKVEAERLADIVLAPTEEHADAAAPSRQGSATMELEGVTFRYADTEPEVLRNVSLRVEDGEFVAIAGASGSGKTTLLKVILGIHKPLSGKVKIGGRTLEQMGSRAWREQIACVMQDDTLFAGSIAENISFFDSAPDMDWVEQCARLASIHQDIVEMPMGYETFVGQAYAALSGGQRQRVLLARAIYKKPRILFLDEATSALDVESERVVNDAICHLSMTRIVIAHRPETIAAAQRVIEIAGGEIRPVG